jgi:hypothetical protein
MSSGFEAAVADSVSVTMVSRSNSDPLILVLSIRQGPHRHRRTLGVCGTHRATARPPRATFFRIKAWAFHVPEERPCLSFLAHGRPNFVAIPVPGLPRN